VKHEPSKSKLSNKRITIVLDLNLQSINNCSLFSRCGEDKFGHSNVSHANIQDKTFNSDDDDDHEMFMTMKWP